MTGVLYFKDQEEKFKKILDEYNETVKYNVLEYDSNIQDFSQRAVRLKKSLNLLKTVAKEYSVLIELELEEFKQSNW